MLTDKQKRFIELERRKDEIKKYYEDFGAAINDLVQENGLGHYFMDEQGIVYGIVEAEGKWIPYEKYTYVRTKREGEQRGTLSVKEAQERGFQVK
jgi:hypothetical protein